MVLVVQRPTAYTPPVIGPHKVQRYRSDRRNLAESLELCIESSMRRIPAFVQQRTRRYLVHLDLFVPVTEGTLVVFVGIPPSIGLGTRVPASVFS